MESMLLRGKRRRKCNTRIYSIQLWYKQNKKNLLLRKSNNKYTQKIASKNVLTWHWPSRVHILSTPIAMVTELGWLALGAQCRRVFSIFSSRWNFHSPLIFALRRDDPSEGCGAMCSRVCIVGKGHHPDDRRRQLACDIWPRRFCQCDTRAFLLTTFSVLIQFCFLLLFCRIIRFSSVCFGFFRLLCFLHFWLNYCKKNKHCQTGSDTLQPFVPIG